MQRQDSRPRPRRTSCRSNARRSCGKTVPAAERDGLQGVLENDPRPSYQHDPQRVYGMEFGPVEVHFTVDGEVLTVTGIARR